MNEKTIVREEGRYKVNGYYDYEICKECKGTKCCAHFGCMYSPKDFIVLSDSKYNYEQQLLILYMLLQGGKISIDMCWIKDSIYGPLNPITKRPDIDKMSNGDGLLYLRARNKKRPIVDLQFFLDEFNDYPCVNWNPKKGCKLNQYERPYIGRMLKPVKVTNGENTTFRCVLQGEEETLLEWSKYQLLMYDLYLKARDLDNK